SVPSACPAPRPRLKGVRSMALAADPNHKKGCIAKVVVPPPPHSLQKPWRVAQPTCWPAAMPVAAEFIQSAGFKSTRLSAVPLHKAAWVLALPTCWPSLTASAAPAPRSTALSALPLHNMACFATDWSVAMRPALPTCWAPERPATDEVVEPVGVKSIIV